MRAWPLLLMLQVGCVLDLTGLTGGVEGGSGGGSPSSCLEGCPGGACTPVATPTDPQLPVFRVAVAPESVVFADPTASELGRVDGAGERRVGVMAAPQTAAVHGDRLYFATASQGIFVCGLPACDGVAELVPMGPETFARQLVADQDQLYWITGPDLSDGAVYRVSVTGGSPVLVASGQVRPHGIAIDDERIYWTVHQNGGDDGVIRSAPKAGGAVVDLLSGLSAPSGIAVGGGSVVFTSSAVDGAVHRAPSDGSGPPELVTDGPVPVNDPIAQPASVAIVDSQVVWTNDGDGSVMACPLTGCSQNDAGQPSIVARGLTAPGSLVADGRCIAWGAGEGIFVTSR